MKTRQTRQREAIRAAFRAASGPLRPQELQALALRAGEPVAIATVYRNLNIWLEEGWLSLVQLPGEPARYELSDKGHHHYFACRGCARVFDLSSCVQQGLKRLVPSGFELERHEIFLYGRCEACS